MNSEFSIKVNKDNFITYQKILFDLGYFWIDGTQDIEIVKNYFPFNFYINIDIDYMMFYNPKKYYPLYNFRKEKLKKLL